ncbi:DUF427 domain-containing protein [Epibacterium sp. SM1979]|uniref:DUF427 domain-containing protein n=1 Tax=Tritonibacter litoralis TaxID=2662264 RepID=A0A843YFW5_9RHOB|nr:DUF427 domain-containing protein [Tritonibacter litoralis]MQQ08163.1 DUF427 domain-containing protein [Tritonibacter litoralis]
MNVHVHPQRGGYGILVEDLPHPVSIRYQGELLAQCSRAKVMFETRQSPAIYFPADELKAALIAKDELRTFCPLKGTARYYDLDTRTGSIDMAAWEYDCPFPGVEGIERFVSFTHHQDLEIDTGDNEILSPAYGNISGPLVDWLMRDASFIDTPEAFTRALAHKLTSQGIALSRLSVMAWSLHPMIAGKNFIWSKNQDKVTLYTPSYELYDEPAYHNSPIRHVAKGLGGVRHRLNDGSDIDAFPILEDLQRDGATDYVAMPLPFTDGRINVLTVASDHPDGFSTSDLGLIFECSAVISRYYEVFAQRDNAKSLLETYVGKRSGSRVLGGEIRRGDGDEIDAAIMFCDLRRSTRLQETLGRDAYITLLNRFFESTSDHVHENGGEVLKFIGDAVLAVFPAGDDPDQARTKALLAARDSALALTDMREETGVADLDCAIGVAYGSVTYGNIGSRERLDFTVIGQAANIAARLGDYGKTIGAQIVVSRNSLCSKCSAEPLGELVLHNVGEAVEAFSVPVIEAKS